jgi:dTDP-4-dehydrorhamnose 3,5-epimerase-like enzyme
MKITGIKIFKKKLIKNKKGNILKYISKKDKFIKKFGEIYFSYLKKNKKKGWNYHKKNNCFLICISGNVKIHLIDGRKNFKSYNKELKINLNQNLGAVLKIPPGIWFSLISPKKDSILSNFLENVYEKRESIKKDLIKNYYIKN